MKALTDLINHPQDLRTVLGVYLDLSNPYEAVSNKAYPVFRAMGIGYDGELQGFSIGEKGFPSRWYRYGGRLPRENGRILALLYQLGYELPAVQKGVAKRYIRPCQR
jgi:hypothetical protein